MASASEDGIPPVQTKPSTSDVPDIHLLFCDRNWDTKCKCFEYPTRCSLNPYPDTNPENKMSPLRAKATTCYLTFSCLLWSLLLSQLFHSQPPSLTSSPSLFPSYISSFLFLPLCKFPPLGLQIYSSLSCLKNKKPCLPSKYPSNYNLFYLLFLTLLSFNGMVYGIPWWSSG